MSRLWSITAVSFLCTSGLVVLGASWQRAGAASATPTRTQALAQTVTQAVAPAVAAAAVAAPRGLGQATESTGAMDPSSAQNASSAAVPARAVPAADAASGFETATATPPAPGWLASAAPASAAPATSGGGPWDQVISWFSGDADAAERWGDERFVLEHPTSVPDLQRSGLDLVLSAPLRSRTYQAPAWFPVDDATALDDLAAIADAPARTKGPLRLASRAAFVWDLDAGRALLTKNADDLRPVASLTKVVSALTVVAEGADLDAPICLDSTARSGWPGAASKLKRGACVDGWDLLGAALVKSDNGAAYALPRVSDTPHYAFVARMNTLARELAMDQSSFADPSGADDDNLSTARDMTRAAIALAAHPTLAPIASAPLWVLEDQAEGTTRHLITTNELIGRADTELLAAKTGYTDTARYCFTGVFRLSNGRTVAVTTLGAGRNRDRWSDLRAILAWAEAEGTAAG